MDAEGLLFGLGALLYWRITLCLIASSLAAFALLHVFPWFTGIQGIVLAILGGVSGAAWQEAVRPSKPSPEPARPTDTSVAVVSAAIFSASWAAFSALSLHSALAGAALLVLAAAGWFRYAIRIRGWLPVHTGVACVVVAFAAYPLAAWAAHDVVNMLIQPA